MASRGSVYSQTLHDITNTKLAELAKKRTTFEAQRSHITAVVHDEEDATKRLSILAKDTKTCFLISTSGGCVVRGGSHNPRLELDLRNLDRFLAQARYDPSISPRILEQWQQTMLRHFEVQSLKYEYASLYGQLTTEWLSATQSPVSVAREEDTEMEDFEHVSGGKKLESRLKWEKSVFESKDIDQTTITNLLHDLFESTPEDSKHLLKALETLRTEVEVFERELASPRIFNAASLRWTIRGLLASDLLDNDKRDALRDFMGNVTILGEIADVLNMRMTALADWSWGDEVLLDERRQLNGTYNIYMREDLLQAIFLQYIGVRWSVFWKQKLSQLRKSPKVWKSSRASIAMLVRKRREYYLGALPERPSFESKKQRIYRKGYFLSQLLDSETQEAFGDEGDEEADFEEMHIQASAAPKKRAMQTARMSTGGQAPRKQMASTPAQRVAPSARGVQAHFANFTEEDEEEDTDDDDSGKPKNPMEAKQNLLHLLSADTLIKTRLHGELTCFRSQIDALYPSLPHSTIESVLEFFGVSKKWLHFFNQFLKAPLRFADDESSGPRQRQNGTPGSHVLSEVFGEVILFCLDFQINQETGGEPLWRMQDDFWFWSSSHATCERAWSTVVRFMKIMGLEHNKARTGAVRMARQSKQSAAIVALDVGDTLPHGQIRWGMLFLNPQSGRFEIDQEMVDKHIEELSRQLKEKTNNIFAWIQAWNSYAATFFTTNFGTPANCFGRQHVDNMLATHERIQKQVFSSSSRKPGSLLGHDSGSVIEFLRRTIEQRFGVKDIPDGYFYFPTELGGLEVRNPFIGLLQIRHTVRNDNCKQLDEFEEAEKEAYRCAKARFDRGERATSKPYHPLIDPNFRPQDPDIFFSFEEYTKYREQLCFGFPDELHHVFSRLLERPREEGIETDQNGEVKVALNALVTRSAVPGLRDILADWYSMENYWQWVAQLYGPEMIKKFGGFGIVEPGLLPMGMVSLFRSGRVNWQE